MENCVNCQKKVIVRVIASIINLKSKDIEAVLHLSKSVVSRHMTGEHNRPEIDIYKELLIANYPIKELFKSVR